MTTLGDFARRSQIPIVAYARATGPVAHGAPDKQLSFDVKMVGDEVHLPTNYRRGLDRRYLGWSAMP